MDGQNADNPLRDYMLQRMIEQGLNAAGHGITGGMITGAGLGMGPWGTPLTIMGLANMLRGGAELYGANEARNGAQMWSSTGMPPRPTQMPPPPEDAQQPQQQGAPVNPLYLR